MDDDYDYEGEDLMPYDDDWIYVEDEFALAVSPPLPCPLHVLSRKLAYSAVPEGWHERVVIALLPSSSTTCTTLTMLYAMLMMMMRRTN